MYKLLFFSVVIILFGCTISIHAQSLRTLNNDGVDNYKEGKYTDAEVNFKKGHEKEPGYVTTFNLGDAYYKQKRYDEAIKSYENALTQHDDKEFKSKVHHNIGNSYLQSQKYKESIQAYKEALKLNPDDNETKYNLSYALSMLNDQQNKQQQKDDQNKNDQNKDQQKDQDNKNQDQQKQNNENKGQNDQNRPDQNQTTKQDNLKQPQQNKISKAEAERILNALKNSEQDLQKKLRKQKGTPVKTEKDW
ncbi:MAG: tetratricopeptide repeat protein [Ignavibacteriales bacterium]|nr:MAG: tetratricopeptide repeat protein [Ignavibacteriales bacterium]